ncbi:KH domain-containing protein [bacterium]|nr:KH domain-containing protein [bacterium]
MDKKLLKKEAEELLKLLGEEDFSLAIEEGEDKEKILRITTASPGSLIGYRGRTLEAFQLILKLILSQQTGEWSPVLVEVNDYREKQKERLYRKLQRMGEEVLTTGKPVSLPPMPAYKRRLVHLFFSDSGNLTTVSEGEGEQRHVIIKPKENE